MEDDISILRKVIIWKISRCNNIFYKMKYDLTTGTWQDNIRCPISIILFCISDVPPLPGQHHGHLPLLRQRGPAAPCKAGPRQTQGQGTRGRGAWPSLPAYLRPSNLTRRACCLCRCHGGHPPPRDRGCCWPSPPHCLYGPTLWRRRWTRWGWMPGSSSLLVSRNE